MPFTGVSMEFEKHLFRQWPLGNVRNVERKSRGETALTESVISGCAMTSGIHYPLPIDLKKCAGQSSRATPSSELADPLLPLSTTSATGSRAVTVESTMTVLDAICYHDLCGPSSLLIVERHSISTTISQSSAMRELKRLRSSPEWL